MRTVSWILLTVATLLILFGSLASLSLAYLGSARDDVLVGNVTLAEVVGDRQDVEHALRGRRGTAAAYAAGFAVLLLFVILVPYRQGAVWAWWAVLVSVAILSLIILARLAFLETSLGAMVGVIMLAVFALGLLLDLKRLRT